MSFENDRWWQDQELSKKDINEKQLLKNFSDILEKKINAALKISQKSEDLDCLFDVFLNLEELVNNELSVFSIDNSRGSEILGITGDQLEALEDEREDIIEELKQAVERLDSVKSTLSQEDIENKIDRNKLLRKLADILKLPEELIKDISQKSEFAARIIAMIKHLKNFAKHIESVGGEELPPEQLKEWMNKKQTIIQNLKEIVVQLEGEE